MPCYVILDEYCVDDTNKKHDSKYKGIHVHTSIKVNGELNPTIDTFVYFSENGNHIPFQSLTRFMEKTIPKNYKVFMSAEYSNKFEKSLSSTDVAFILEDVTKFCQYCGDKSILQKHIEECREASRLEIRNYFNTISRK